MHREEVEDWEGSRRKNTHSGGGGAQKRLEQLPHERGVSQGGHEVCGAGHDSSSTAHRPTYAPVRECELPGCHSNGVGWVLKQPRAALESMDGSRYVESTRHSERAQECPSSGGLRDLNVVHDEQHLPVARTQQGLNRVQPMPPSSCVSGQVSMRDLPARHEKCRQAAAPIPLSPQHLMAAGSLPTGRRGDLDEIVRESYESSEPHRSGVPASKKRGFGINYSGDRTLDMLTFLVIPPTTASKSITPPRSPGMRPAQLPDRVLSHDSHRLNAGETELKCSSGGAQLPTISVVNSTKPRLASVTGSIQSATAASSVCVERPERTLRPLTYPGVSPKTGAAHPDECARMDRNERTVYEPRSLRITESKDAEEPSQGIVSARGPMISKIPVPPAPNRVVKSEEAARTALLAVGEGPATPAGFGFVGDDDFTREGNPPSSMFDMLQSRANVIRGARPQPKSHKATSLIKKGTYSFSLMTPLSQAGGGDVFGMSSFMRRGTEELYTTTSNKTMNLTTATTTTATTLGGLTGSYDESLNDTQGNTEFQLIPANCATGTVPQIGPKDSLLICYDAQRALDNLSYPSQATKNQPLPVLDDRHIEKNSSHEPHSQRRSTHSGQGNDDVLSTSQCDVPPRAVAALSIVWKDREQAATQNSESPEHCMDEVNLESSAISCATSKDINHSGEDEISGLQDFVGENSNLSRANPDLFRMPLAGVSVANEDRKYNGYPTWASINSLEYSHNEREVQGSPWQSVNRMNNSVSKNEYVQDQQRHYQAILESVESAGQMYLWWSHDDRGIKGTSGNPCRVSVGIRSAFSGGSSSSAVSNEESVQCATSIVRSAPGRVVITSTRAEKAPGEPTQVNATQRKNDGPKFSTAKTLDAPQVGSRVAQQDACPVAHSAPSGNVVDLVFALPQMGTKERAVRFQSPLRSSGLQSDLKSKPRDSSSVSIGRRNPQTKKRRHKRRVSHDVASQDGTLEDDCSQSARSRSEHHSFAGSSTRGGEALCDRHSTSSQRSSRHPRHQRPSSNKKRSNKSDADTDVFWDPLHTPVLESHRLTLSPAPPLFL